MYRLSKVNRRNAHAGHAVAPDSQSLIVRVSLEQILAAASTEKPKIVLAAENSDAKQYFFRVFILRGMIDLGLW